MDIQEIIKIAEQVPELTEQIASLQSEISELKRKPGYKDILTAEDIHEITGFKSPTTVRKMINDIGNAKYRGRDFVLREDFKNFFKTRKNLSEEDIENAITDYEIKRAKKLAKIKSNN
ncbi:hypothetical protein D9V86_09925 [Bacteroidetes/Chlorobi group bacterium ChocPot_Mid]|nr:MAG: hypothetical protein D9V86_09925 [Bacteroidetes/Chlorobi group bacterium ChocPot_Mid]